MTTFSHFTSRYSKLRFCFLHFLFLHFVVGKADALSNRGLNLSSHLPVHLKAMKD